MIRDLSRSLALPWMTRVRAASHSARLVNAVVLTLGAWDGVFLSGGMVPLLLPALQHSGFRQRFEGKGRYAPAMARVPTLAVVHPNPGLLGTAAIAASDRAARDAG